MVYEQTILPGIPKSNPWQHHLLFAVILAFICAIATNSNAQSSPKELPYLPLSYYQERGLINKGGIAAREMMLQSGADPYLLETRIENLYTTSTYTIDMRDTGEVINNSIRFANVGTGDIINPWVVINNQRDWFDIRSLATEVYGTETDPEKRAFRVWSFLKRNRYHWPAAEEDAEIHDPVRYLNVYGYGFCDDTARTAEALFWAGGFSKARMWWLDGHAVPEVFYNDAWHLFDPDTEVFYPKWDNKTVASAEDCMDDGELVRRVSGDFIESFYVSKENNTTAQWTFTYSHSMGMRLRPGESFERFWYNWGKYHEYSYDIPPLHYGNGRFVYEPPLNAEYSRNGFFQWDNMTRDIEPGAGSYLRIDSSDAPGVLEIRMGSPYVFVGGSIQFDYSLETASDSIEVDFGKNTSYSVQEIGDIVGPSSGTVTFSLDNAIAPLESYACYLFGSRITMKGSEPTSAKLRNLKVTGDVQLSVISLPAVEAQKINDVSVRLAPGPGGMLQVSHTYYKRVDGALPPRRSSGPITPANLSVIHTTAPDLQWYLEQSSWPLQNHEMTISWDPDGLLPVSPMLHLFKTSPQATLTVPAEWLIPGSTYYWRARGNDNQGLQGDWSESWRFTIHEDTVPTSNSTITTQIPTPNPTPTPTPSDKLQIGNINQASYALDILEPGKRVYVDADFSFLSPIPSDMLNMFYLQTYNGDRSQSGDEFLTFDINQPAIVVIAVDENAPLLPSWMKTWHRRNEKLRISGTSIRRDMYQKQFGTGRVVLGGPSEVNYAAARSMYSVIVLPTLASAQDWQLYE